MKKYLLPVIMLTIFEAIALTLWLSKDNLFYLLNFSYIGIALALGIVLYIKQYPHARRVTQLLVGMYMLLYLGLIRQENMQIEGFWYYLFLGVFEAATIHYTVAKLFGPLIFGRGWCGYACWTAMVLDFLPYKVPKQPRKKRIGMDKVFGFSCLTRLCRDAFFGTGRSHRGHYILGVHYWQCAVLPCRDWLSLSF